MPLHQGPVTCRAVLSIFAGEPIETVESDRLGSTYWYRCGCVVGRKVDSNECTVTPCSTHRTGFAERLKKARKSNR